MVPSDGSIATVIPPSLGEVHRLFGPLGPLTMRATSEGVASPAGTQRDSLSLELPSGRQVVGALFRAAGFDPIRSDPGSIAEQLISQVGGLYMTAIFRHWELLTLIK